MREVELKNISWRIAVNHDIEIGFDDVNKRSFYYIPDEVSDFNKAYWNKSCVITTENGRKTLKPRKEYEKYFAEREGFNSLQSTKKKGEREDFLELLYKKGTGFVDGKSRITKFYEEVNSHTKVECIEFLKREHGIGGGTFSYKYNQPWSYDTDAKGIAFGFYDERNNVSFEYTYTWAEYDAVLRRIVSVKEKVE